MDNWSYNPIWAVLSDEQMSNGWPFSLLNDEQMSNKVGVENQPAILIGVLIPLVTGDGAHLV